MKKLIMLSVAILNIAFVSCNNKETTSENVSSESSKKYICPMKCEGEKTYPKEGECPVCHMELKEVKD